MRRGDLVIASSPGDCGKPRPHLIVQADALERAVDSVVLCPLSSHLRGVPFCVPVAPDLTNGLRERSEVLIDKVVSLPRSKLSHVIGHLDAATLVRIDGALMWVLGLGPSSAG